MEPGPVLAILIVSAGGVFVWALSLRYRRRELEHKERLAAIEKGAEIPEMRNGYGPHQYLLRGLIWLLSGIALSVFLFGLFVTTQRPRSIGDRIYEAKRIQELGGTQEQIQEARNDTTPRQGIPLGLCLLGLVPASIGVAYLIFYQVEKKSQAPR